MAELTLFLSEDPRALLEHAADGYLSPPRASASDPFPSPRFMLALRQGGLRDDLIALAAARSVGGWYDPAFCIFHELPTYLGSTLLTPCSSIERAALLAECMRSSGGELFGRFRRSREFLQSVEQLFGELASEGVTADEYDRAVGSWAPGTFEHRRDSGLARGYRAYSAALLAAGKRDGRDNWSDSAQAVRADPDGLARRLKGRRELRLFGLQDLRSGWRDLLAALVDSAALDRVSIYSSVAPEIPAQLPHTVVELSGASTSLARRLFGTTRGDEVIPLIAAPDAERELEEVARRIHALATAGTAPLERIAIITRQARPYVDLALAALARFGVPATARRRIAVQEVPVLRAVRALISAAAAGWSRHELIEVAEHPYLAPELDARLLNKLGYQRHMGSLDEWDAALAELVLQTKTTLEATDDSTRRHRGGVPATPADANGALEGFRRFALVARELDGERPLDEWVSWLLEFLRLDPFGIQARLRAVPDGRFDIVRLDLQGWDLLVSVLEEWRRVLQVWGGGKEMLTPSDFSARLEDLLDGDVPLWTETMRGVQVVEGLAAAYRSFDHVFLVGLEAGRFPVRAPSSSLLDDSDRSQLQIAGLPLEPRGVWDARERELFRLLVASASKSLTISFARQDADGRETIRSAWVDVLGDVAEVREDTIPTSRVVTPGIRILESPALESHVRHAATIERLRRTGAPSPWNGLIEDPALRAWLARDFGDERIWSATQLESYAKCPWAYFSERLLGLEMREDPDEEMQATTRGTVLHDALARIFTALGASRSHPVLLREGDLERARAFVAPSLALALEAAGQDAWLGAPVFRPARRRELERLVARYLEDEVEHNEKMFKNRGKNPRILRTGVVAHEMKFGDAVLEREGVIVRYRGSIDRVEFGVDERLDATSFVAAVDYKSSKGSTPAGGEKAGWEDGVVLQLPLYAHALRQLEPTRRVSRVEYRVLRKHEIVHALEMYQVQPKTLALEPDEAAAARMEQALDSVVSHVRNIRGGDFPAEPAPSCHCPPFCGAWDICRVKGGPKTGRER